MSRPSNDELMAVIFSAMRAFSIGATSVTIELQPCANVMTFGISGFSVYRTLTKGTVGRGFAESMTVMQGGQPLWHMQRSGECREEAWPVFKDIAMENLERRRFRSIGLVDRLLPPFLYSDRPACNNTVYRFKGTEEIRGVEDGDHLTVYGTADYHGRRLDWP